MPRASVGVQGGVFADHHGDVGVVEQRLRLLRALQRQRYVRLPQSAPTRRPTRSRRLADLRQGRSDDLGRGLGPEARARTGVPDRAAAGSSTNHHGDNGWVVAITIDNVAEVLGEMPRSGPVAVSLKRCHSSCSSGSSVASASSNMLCHHSADLPMDLTENSLCCGVVDHGWPELDSNSHRVGVLPEDD